MPRYAQIDGVGVCIAVSDLSANVDGPDMILIGAADFPLGHSLVEGAWVAPPPPSPTYRFLSKMEFFRLLTGVGGMTMEGLVAAKSDASLAAFWVLLELTTEVHQDAPEIGPALMLLESLGYLTEGGAAAVNAAWPTQ